MDASATTVAVRLRARPPSPSPSSRSPHSSIRRKWGFDVTREIAYVYADEDEGHSRGVGGGGDAESPLSSRVTEGSPSSSSSSGSFHDGGGAGAAREGNDDGRKGDEEEEEAEEMERIVLLCRGSGRTTTTRVRRLRKSHERVVVSWIEPQEVPSSTTNPSSSSSSSPARSAGLQLGDVCVGLYGTNHPPSSGYALLKGMMKDASAIELTVSRPSSQAPEEPTSPQRCGSGSSKLHRPSSKTTTATATATAEEAEAQTKEEEENGVGGASATMRDATSTTASTSSVGGAIAAIRGVKEEEDGDDEEEPRDNSGVAVTIEENVDEERRRKQRWTKAERKAAKKEKKRKKKERKRKEHEKAAEQAAARDEAQKAARKAEKREARRDARKRSRSSSSSLSSLAVGYGSVVVPSSNKDGGCGGGGEEVTDEASYTASSACADADGSERDRKKRKKKRPFVVNVVQADRDRDGDTPSSLSSSSTPSVDIRENPDEASTSSTGPSVKRRKMRQSNAVEKVPPIPPRALTMGATMCDTLSDAGSTVDRASDDRSTVTAGPQPSMAGKRAPQSRPLDRNEDVIRTKLVPRFEKDPKTCRLYPDPSPFYERLMSWVPPEPVVADDSNGSVAVRFRGGVATGRAVEPSSSRRVLPDVYCNADDLAECIVPKILEEGVLSLNQEHQSNSNRDGFWTRPTFELCLKSCARVRHIGSMDGPLLYEFTFRLKESTAPPSFLGELFAVYCREWKRTRCCIGVIGSNDTFLEGKKERSAEGTFRLWLCVARGDNKGTGWLAASDLPRTNIGQPARMQSMHVVNIGTSVTMIREYEALCSTAHLKTHLKRTIFCQKRSADPAQVHPEKGGETKQSIAWKKPPSIPLDTWTHITTGLNRFQSGAIAQIMWGKSTNGVYLQVGTPGAGKTTTIVSLVTALLAGGAPKPGAKPSGTRVHVGKTFSTGGHDCTMDRPVPRRILVCAPSNTAIDDLAWRLHTSALGPTGKSFRITRFGMLPNEERHDGRGRSRRGRSCRQSSTNSERNSFLRRINLDFMVENIASRDYDDDYSKMFNGLSRKARTINYTEERRKILTKSHVICTTLSGAGSKAFIDSVCRDECPDSEFDAVIIDEACAASEASSLIPLKFNPSLVVMAGDPQQLPVLCLSPWAGRTQFDRSLFQRLQQINWPVVLLRIQYRMDRSIMSFPSRRFYNGKLIESKCVKRRDPSHWHIHPCFPNFVLWDVSRGVMKSSNGRVSNTVEVKFITELLEEFSNLFLKGAQKISIGIIAFYNEQVVLLTRAVNSMPWFKSSKKVSVEISTVDGFQGAEKDIIILSCVRAESATFKARGVGFLKDPRRVNVALTRAKRSLWIVGNCAVLQTDALWREIVNDARKRKCIRRSDEFGKSSKDFRRSCDIQRNKQQQI